MGYFQRVRGIQRIGQTPGGIRLLPFLELFQLPQQHRNNDQCPWLPPRRKEIPDTEKTQKAMKRWE